jgi:phenylacetate-coenzyme A ligase PaaK-like adenylate-forming protein
MGEFLDAIYERAVGRGLLPFYETQLRGRSTFRHRAEFLANQWRSPEEIAALQWERLGALLRHAYATVPYYRAAFDRLGLFPEGIHTPADFARLPVLEKQTVRAERERLLSSAYDPRELIVSATGGSTGEPMQFCYNRDSYQWRVAAAMRGDEWAGWQLCAPEFYIWGVTLLPQRGWTRVKRQIHHASLRRSVINSFELAAERIPAIVERYNRLRPRVVIGFANAIYEFARFVRQSGRRLHRPRGIVSSAEKLFGYQRELIESVFQAPVFDRYGCREMMMIGAECDQHRGLHVTADNLLVEVVQGGRACGPDERGEILLTDLHNYGMPLIRYKVGDAGSWSEHTCPCGRGLPLLNVVEGRTLDLIRTPSGRVISGEFFPHLLKDFASIRRYQVVQECEDTLRIRLAVDSALPEADHRLLRETITRTLGPEMRLDWEIGTDLVIETGNKFRPVLSRVPVNLDAPSLSGQREVGAGCQ